MLEIKAAAEAPELQLRHVLVLSEPIVLKVH